MLNGVPIGTVCPFAGQIHPITGDINNIWTSSGCSSQNAQAESLNANIPPPILKHTVGCCAMVVILK